LENVKGGDHLEGLGIDGKIIRMDLSNLGWEVVDWMHGSG